MDNPQKTAPRKDNRLFGQELEKRTLNFGVRIIKLSYRLPRTLEVWGRARQDYEGGDTKRCKLPRGEQSQK